MSIGITRRAMLSGLPGCLLASVHSNKIAKPPVRASEFFRFLDPVTETPVVRLTSPANASFLPATTNRFVSVKQRFLVFSSDRTGTLAPFQVDLRTGLLTQLADARNLVPQSLSLNARGNALYMLDGETLHELNLLNRRSRVLADGIKTFCELDGNSGTEPAFIVVRGGRLETLNDARVLAEEVDDFCLARPGGNGCVVRKTGSGDTEQLRYVSLLAKDEHRLLATGRILNPVWTRDGQELLFLRNVSRDSIFLSEICAINPESNVERLVAKTTQFAAFAPNADTSVFVGASRSKAQPTVLLLLASVQRELTLCEHHARCAATVAPVFSPDSKRVYFQSDHEGKSALYSVNVERLVEPTPV